MQAHFECDEAGPVVEVLGGSMANQAHGWLRRPTDTATLRADFLNALGNGMRQASHQ